MLKKRRTLSKSDLYKILFNVAGAAVIMFVSVYSVYAFFVTEETPMCSLRYPAATELALRSYEGDPLSPIEFQSNLVEDHENILENTKIESVTAGPSDVALKVSFVKHDVDQIQGARFNWRPLSFDKTGSSCLTYHVFVPETVDFSKEAVLPGFHAAGYMVGDNDQKQDVTLATRLRWTGKGKLSFASDISDERGGHPFGTFKRWSGDVVLPKGRWVEIEQEFSANTAGKPNGTYRLWVDNKLAIEKTKVSWSPKGAVQLTSTNAALGYLPSKRGEQTTSNDNTFVSLSPLQLRWQ